MDYKLCRLLALMLSLFLSACAGFSDEINPPTGNLFGPVVGGGLGITAGALMEASKPITGLLGIGGAGLGYYVTTLRFAGKGIIDAGGRVYAVGQHLVIYIPTDNLFDPNTADFLDGTQPILDSIVMVLARYPRNNIFISGNTSGFLMPACEQHLSEERAKQVASYLWAHGIKGNHKLIRDTNIVDSRRLVYVGYGDKFPVSNKFRVKGLRENSRIQIVAYPSDEALYWDTCKKNFEVYPNENATI